MSSPPQQTQDLSSTSIHHPQNQHSPSSPLNVASPAGPSNGLTNMLTKGEILSPQSVHRSPDSPQPELATMTNVNVLDLHTDSKMYDKDAVFIYDNPKVNVLQAQDHVIDARLTHGHLHAAATPSASAAQPQHQLLTKIEVDENQIIRVVGPNGEQQQIISREIINGEHHILSRNEAGEHILTRIVEDPSKLLPNDSAALYAQTQKITTEGAVYQTAHLDTSTLQYSHPADSVEAQAKNNQVVSIYNDHKKSNQIIYTHGDTKDLMYEKGSASLGEQSKIGGGMYEKPQIDLIYQTEDNKTVIYTTTSDQKGLEIYSGADLGGLVTEGQVVVQGGLQYASSATTTQAGGQAVFIVSDSLPPGVEEQLQR